jgi:peptide-methionine (S)-S-oxide reductase
MSTTRETAVLGGGCFWCTEAVFSAGGGSAYGGKMFRGVISVTPGYSGGSIENPSYEDVSSGRTGHVEVIRIEYDSSLVSYETLLTIFFASHDPTTPNRQGADVGTQYRSIIFYTTDKQREQAEQFIEKINASSKDGAPAVTEIEPLKKFYPAEDYHRDYYARNKNAGYCQMVINPKLEKVQKEFVELLNNPNEEV